MAGVTLPQLLTEKQAADYLKWSPYTLQQRRSHCQEPAYIKLGGRAIRYEAEALREFVDQGRVNPGTGGA